MRHGSFASDQLTSEACNNSTSSKHAVGYTYDYNHNRASKTTTFGYDASDQLTSEVRAGG